MTLLSSPQLYRGAVARLPHASIHVVSAIAMFFFLLTSGGRLAAQDAGPDVLVLSNGDTLHGKFVSEIGGKVMFHSDPLGDVTLEWSKIKELHTAGSFAVIDKNMRIRGKKSFRSIPTGTIEMTNQSLTLHTESAHPRRFPVANTAFIMDKATLDKQLYHSPGFLTGWNGAATAGATLVPATQNQYTFSGGVGLVRVVPTASWLTPRNRTSSDFTGSYGKIPSPSYTIPTTLNDAAHFCPLGRRRVRPLPPRRGTQQISLPRVYTSGKPPSIMTSPRICNSSRSMAAASDGPS